MIDCQSEVQINIRWRTQGYLRSEGEEELETTTPPEGRLLSDLPVNMITQEDGRRRAASCRDHGNSHRKRRAPKAEERRAEREIGKVMSRSGWSRDYLKRC